MRKNFKWSFNCFLPLRIVSWNDLRMMKSFWASEEDAQMFKSCHTRPRLRTCSKKSIFKWNKNLALKSWVNLYWVKFFYDQAATLYLFGPKQAVAESHRSFEVRTMFDALETRTKRVLSLFSAESFYERGLKRKFLRGISSKQSSATKAGVSFMLGTSKRFCGQLDLKSNQVNLFLWWTNDLGLVGVQRFKRKKLLYEGLEEPV